MNFIITNRQLAILRIIIEKDPRTYRELFGFTQYKHVSAIQKIVETLTDNKVINRIADKWAINWDLIIDELHEVNSNTYYLLDKSPLRDQIT